MSTKPILSLIVAKTRNNVIGRDGDMPWHLSSDLKFFKETTLGKPVLMGRVTWDSLMGSLGRALPGRPNFVLTRDRNFKAKGAIVCHSLHDMIGAGYQKAGAIGASEIMIMGGAQIYANSMAYVDRMYITEVDAILDGDAHFPAIRSDQWEKVSDTAYPKAKGDDYGFNIGIFDRKR